MFALFRKRRCVWLSIAVSIFGMFWAVSARSEALTAAEKPADFHFHHEAILGTSFDLVVRSVDATAAVEAERVALTEIERLRKILSSYDSESEVSRLNSTSDPMLCSPELIEVLEGYESWRVRSGGAYNGQLAELIEIWRAAEKRGMVPDEASLSSSVRAISSPGWLVNAGERTVQRLRENRVDVNSLGKGYIVQRAAAAIRTALPELAGLLINIGGDICASSRAGAATPWRIGVADPKDASDNAAPLTEVWVSDRAISTSGSYERSYRIAGRRFSHIMDPRTGFPAERVASATVVARDNATANALATTLCVLPPGEGLALVKETAGAECLIIATDGEQFRSAQFAALEIPATGAAKKGNEAKPSLWPKDFQVSITVALKGPAAGGGGYKRPYVAIWVDNEKGQRVRTVTVWGNKERYFPDLHDWSYGEKDRLAWAASIARATRPPGRHRVTWDGRDDSGNPLPTGTYTIFVEANREHGTYAKQSGKIVCGREPTHAVIKASSEFDESQLAYGPPESPSK